MSGAEVAPAVADDDDALARRLGHRFARPELLTAALTHATYTFERPGATGPYERLEFLGDAVLGLLAAELLLRRLGAASEGELSRRRARMVCRDALAQIGRGLGLAPHVRLGVGQRATTGVTDGILADVVEAVAGAVYLDAGTAAAARTFTPLLAAQMAATAACEDAKTRLQEACHRLRLPPPRYAVLGTAGPDHAQTFRCAVRLAGGIATTATAPSKRAAEQACARAALAQLTDGGARPRGDADAAHA